MIPQPALVTGASGFVGANVARALVAAGVETRVLARRESPRTAIDGLPVKVIEGDLRDAASVERALDGVKTLFHVAALFTFWGPDAEEFRRVNVEGTRAVLDAALRAGVERIVVTSTVGTIGSVPPGQRATEETPFDLGPCGDPYINTKHEAEQVALSYASRVPLTVVNPTAVIGPWDVKPTPTGKFIVDLLHGRVPAYLGSWMDVVDAEDVGRGHLLAAEMGRSGERYILAGEALAMGAICRLVGRLGDHWAPFVRLPMWMALLSSYPMCAWSRLVTKRPPLLTPAFVRLARKNLLVDGGKARRELGFTSGPAEGAFSKAIAWFREHHYVKR